MLTPLLVVCGALAANPVDAHDAIQAPEPAPGDRFGAVMACDGALAAIASREHVHIFRREAETWTHDGTVESTGAIAIDENGPRLMVGNRRANGSNGEVLIYRRVASRWLEEARLAPDQRLFEPRFGAAVDLDGDRCIVGAPSETGEAPLSGAAYIFRSNGSAWVQEAKLTVAGATQETHHGWDVAISGDLCAITSQQPIMEYVTSAGRVTVFRLENGTWKQMTTLTPTNGEVSMAAYPVALKGNILVAGGYKKLRGDDRAEGIVYVYALQDDAWTVEAILRGGPLDKPEFGNTLALEGELLAATDLLSAAWLFERQDGRWRPIARRQSTGESSIGADVGLASGCCLLGPSAREHRDAPAGGSVTVWRAPWTGPGVTLIPRSLSDDELAGLDRNGLTERLALIALARRATNPDDPIAARLRDDFLAATKRIQALGPATDATASTPGGAVNP